MGRRNGIQLSPGVPSNHRLLRPSRPYRVTVSFWATCSHHVCYRVCTHTQTKKSVRRIFGIRSHSHPTYTPHNANIPTVKNCSMGRVSRETVRPNAKNPAHTFFSLGVSAYSIADVMRTSSPKRYSDSVRT